MLILRSLAFNIAFYLNVAVLMICGFFFYFTPRSWSMWALKQWSRTSLFWLKWLAGITLEVRGQEHVPQTACLIALKHQSAFETFALFHLFRDPAIVLKRELMWLPLMGWFNIKFQHIPVDRDAGPKALRRLIAHAKRATGKDRQILIFPEGTRRPVGAEPDYKPGVAALYTQLDVPCIPAALNSGVFWPRRSFLRHPGTIVVEFLEPLPPGMPRRKFMSELEGRLEPASDSLAREGRQES